MSASREFHVKRARMRRMKRVRMTSGSLGERAQNARDGAREPQPAVHLLVGGRAPLARQCVELGAAVVLRRSPFSLDESLLFEAIERRIQRTFFYPQDLLRKLVNAGSDAVSVIRP